LVIAGDADAFGEAAPGADVVGAELAEGAPVGWLAGGEAVPWTIAG
jgi:hypothetical protein